LEPPGLDACAPMGVGRCFPNPRKHYSRGGSNIPGALGPEPGLTGPRSPEGGTSSQGRERRGGGQAQPTSPDRCIPGSDLMVGRWKFAQTWGQGWSAFRFEGRAGYILFLTSPPKPAAVSGNKTGRENSGGGGHDITQVGFGPVTRPHRAILTNSDHTTRIPAARQRQGLGQRTIHF